MSPKPRKALTAEQKKAKLVEVKALAKRFRQEVDALLLASHGQYADRLADAKAAVETTARALVELAHEAGIKSKIKSPLEAAWQIVDAVSTKKRANMMGTSQFEMFPSLSKAGAP
jgi:hypothetical protein